jgi:hypothetical protein
VNPSVTSGRVSCAHPHTSARPRANTNAEARHKEIADASGLVRGFWTEAEVQGTKDGGAYVLANFYWPDRNVNIPVVVLNINGNTTWGVSFSRFALFAAAAGCPATNVDLARYTSHDTKDNLLGIVERHLCGRHSWLYFEAFAPWWSVPVDERDVFLASDGSYVCPRLSALVARDYLSNTNTSPRMGP